MTSGTRPGRGPAVKCVIWDIDNTLLDGIFIESRATAAAPPTRRWPRPGRAGRRGILHAIASRNPPAAAAHAARVTGGTFAAVQCGWGRQVGGARPIMPSSASPPTPSPSSTTTP